MNNLIKRWILIILIVLLMNLVFIHSTQACTVFCIDKGESLVVGRNQDWNFGEGMLVVNKRNQTKTAFRYSNESKDHLARWTSKYGSISFVQYGREIDFGGMNEAGLVVNVLWLEETKYPMADARPSLSINQFDQYILDNFQSVDEVLAGIRDIRLRPNGITYSHWFVTDRMGQSLVIEYLEGKMVIHAKKTMPVKVLTNDNYELSLKLKMSFPEDTSSEGRFTNAASLVSKYKPGNKVSAVQYAFNILNTVRQGSSTKFQVVFDGHNRMIYFKSLGNSEVRYFRFNGFDFSPGTPSKVLDLNAKLSGDVTAKFVNYSTAINEDLIKRAWENMGLKFSPSDLKLISHYPETFINVSAK